MFIVPILVGVGIYYLFAYTIHFSSTDPTTKPNSIIAMVLWLGGLGAVSWIGLGIMSGVFYMKSLPTYSVLFSIFGLVFFIWFGFVGAFLYTVVREAR